MENTADKITVLAFHLQRLMRHTVIEEAELGKDISLPNLEVLGFVAEQKGLTMKELADTLKITAPSATSMANRLVKANLIKRTSDKSNRKLVRLEITKKGKEIYDKNIKRSKKSVTSMLSVLSEKDQKDMLRIYQKLIDSLT